MSTVDIFSKVKPDNTKWFNFKEVGDAIQGTYIGVSEAKDSFGNNQFIYKLLDTKGDTWNVGIKESNKFCINKMATVRFGQIVGIKYSESIPAKDGKSNPFKKLEIYASPTEVDEEWMKKQTAELEALKRLDSVQGVAALDNEAAELTASAGAIGAALGGAQSEKEPF